MFVESVRLLCVGEYGVVLCKGLMCVRVVHVFIIESLDESPEFVCVCAEINCVKCFLPFESLLCFNFRVDVGVQLLYACESVLCGCKGA